MSSSVTYATGFGGTEVPPAPTLRVPPTPDQPQAIAVGGDIRGTTPMIFGTTTTTPTLTQAPAQSTLAQQIASGQLSQAIQTFQQAIPSLGPGQSIAIAVPAPAPSFIRIQNPVTREIRVMTPADYNATIARGGLTLWDVL